jgi:hypothetical protein
VSLLGTSPPGPVLLRRCRWIAKCKACGIATSRTSSADEARRAPQGSNVYVYAQPKGAPHLNVEGAYVIDCRQCHQPRRANEVRGRYSAKDPGEAGFSSVTGSDDFLRIQSFGPPGAARAAFKRSQGG